jgi:hypothetical protein
MLYAILCYGDQSKVRTMSKEKDEQLMKQLEVVQAQLVREGKLGPHFRLHTTHAAKSMTYACDSLTDGPFAETKEQLLGLYLVDVRDFEEAHGIAKRLGAERVRAGIEGKFEIRPLMSMYDGKSLG